MQARKAIPVIDDLHTYSEGAVVLASATPETRSDIGDRAVALDLDGIILDGMEFHIAAWQEAFSGYGVKLDYYYLYLLEGIKTREVVDRICERYDLDLPKADRELIAAKKKHAYAAIFEPIPIDGAGELLQTLRCHGYKIAIVTGTVATAATAILNKLQMEDYIDRIISSDLDIRGKPDPAPFREATKVLRTPHARCLAVENAPAGITSAVAAGLPCVGVATYLPKQELTEADVVFDNIRVLTLWIDREHGQTGGQGNWILTPGRGTEQQ